MDPNEGRRILRYALFQLPGALFFAALLAAAVRWWDWNPLFAGALMGAWVIKVAYAPDSELERDPLLGARAVVTRPLEPSGWVRVGAELWRAVAAERSARIPAGTSVRVRERRRFTLVVEADDGLSSDRESAPASARFR
jgi:membrane protein implicated in regulation of membrane protease activity